MKTIHKIAAARAIYRAIHAGRALLAGRISERENILPRSFDQ
jgi:hypothetical protein